MSTPPPPSTLAIWLSAARPRTLGAAFAPVFVGAAIAYSDGVLDVLVVLAALAGAIAIQIGTNFANDYFDFLKGADTEERVGPTRATAAGWVTPDQMKWATALAFAALVPPAAYLFYAAGWPMLVIGILGVICGVAYTGGPRPLAYVGLGDIFVLVFFGPVAVAGTYYAQALTLTTVAVVAGLMPGLIATALLAVNNLRDVETDTVAGKRTLAVRFGPGFARGEIAVCLLVPILVIPPVLIALTGGHYGALVSLLAIIPSISVLRRTWSVTGAALIPVLEDIGKTLVIHSFLFGLGWALS